MLLTQFILVDSHFVLCLLSALVLFAIAWLYVDAKDRLSFLGFILLAVSFLVEAVIVDQAILAKSVIGGDNANVLKLVFRILGYLVLIFNQIKVPLQPVPGKEKAKMGAFLIPSSFTLPSIFLLPILAATTGFLYLRRATVGLENHLKPIALGFFILALSELLSLSILFRDTNNILVANLVGPFGMLWILERVLLGVSVFVFGRWVFSYLVKRFDTQLFMIFTTSSLVIFLVTTIFFTFATLNNLTQEAYDSLKTDAGVLGYSIDSKKGELTASAQLIAQNPGLVTAITSADKKKISDITVPAMLSQKDSSIIITSAEGAILSKAEDPEFSGGSLSENSLIKQAIKGDMVSGVSTKDGATAPVVTISAAVPVKDGESIVGAVMVSFDIDSAFTDGVKLATNLDTSIYADNVRSATTFIAPDGVSRWIGIKEETTVVKKTVLIDNKIYSGSVNILNVPYFAVFSPLDDINGNPVGMIFVGRPQVSVLQTAAHSLELTFLVTVALLVLSLLPSYFVSKHIAGQVR